MIVVEPLLRVVAAEVYLPLVNVTVPVGVGLPVPPLTATVTLSDCVVVMLDTPGVTVTVGNTAVTVTADEAIPDALPYSEELFESGV